MKHTYNISPLLQSHTLEFVHQLPFDRAIKLLNTTLPRVKMGPSQAQRLMQYFGELSEVEDQLLQRGFEVEKPKGKGKETLYVQVDGGHLLTDDGY